MVLVTAPKPMPSIHEKKRRGNHHKSTKHYAKTYWPYLPIVMIIGLGVIWNNMWHTGAQVLSYATETSATNLLQETNIQRTQHGHPALALNNQLAAAAQAKAKDMAERNYWAHVNPDGKQPWQFVSDAGYSYKAAGENLAYGFDTSSSTVTGWMNSEGHRLNLLNDTYTEVGFGIVHSPKYQSQGEQTIVVAIYAAPQLAAAANPSVPASGSAGVNGSLAAVPTTMASAQSREVVRLDLLANGTSQWAALAIVFITAAALATIAYRHSKAWRRRIVHGEEFILRHPVLDIVCVTIVVAVVVLAQTSGFIQ